MHRRWFERNDPRIGAQPLRRGGDDVVGNGTDGAELLRNDEIGFEALEELGVEVIEARSGMDRRSNVAIDLLRSFERRRRRSGKFRQAQRFGRIVAFVGDADDFVAGVNAEEYLGSAWKEADYSRRLFALRERITALAVEGVESFGLDDVEAGALGGL